MTTIRSISESLGRFGIDLPQCKDEADILKLVSLKPAAQGSSTPAIFAKNSEQLVARADDFFISVLLCKSNSGDYQQFSRLLKVADKLVERITEHYTETDLLAWAADVHPAVKLAYLYGELLRRDPLFYSNEDASVLVSLASGYSSTMTNVETNAFFEACVKSCALDLAICALDYDAKSSSHDVNRAFFSYLLQSMPAHYYEARRDQVINIAKMLVNNNDLGSIAIDVRNPSVSIQEYVHRCSSTLNAGALACTLLFNEREFINLFESPQREFIGEENQTPSQIIY